MKNNSKIKTQSPSPKTHPPKPKTQHPTPNTQNGFTLIEMIATVSIFVIVITVATGVLVTIIKTQRKNNAQRIIQQESKNVLETITREAKLVAGSDAYPPFTVGNNPPYHTIPPCDPNGEPDGLENAYTYGNQLILVNGSDIKTYFLDKDDAESYGIVKVTEGSDPPDFSKAHNITSENVNVTELKFEVSPDSVADTAAGKTQPKVQPFVNINLSLESRKDTPATRAKATIKTTASSLKYICAYAQSSPPGTPPIPVEPPSEYFASLVAGGAYNSFAIDENGSLWGAGWEIDSGFGIGDDPDTPYTYPYWFQIPTDKIENVVDVSAGFYIGEFTLAVKSDGTVWCAGYNVLTQLGMGPDAINESFTNWTQTKTGDATYLTDVSAVSGKWTHSLALKNDGTVWGAGVNASGELGYDPFVDQGCNYPGDPNPLRSEYWCQIPTINNVKQIDTGMRYSMALKNDGTLWATGLCDDGQLGIGSCSGNKNQWIQTLDNVKAVALGTAHSLALRNDGTVWGTGAPPEPPTFTENVGQLGVGDNNPRDVWTQGITDSGPLTGIVAISAHALTSSTVGSGHSVALKDDGTVWVTGANDYGQLGLGDNNNRNVWTQIPTDVLSNVVYIATGWDHSFAIKSDGTLWVTGHNENGQLGVGDQNDRNTWNRSYLIK